MHFAVFYSLYRSLETLLNLFKYESKPLNHWGGNACFEIQIDSIDFMFKSAVAELYVID